MGALVNLRAFMERADTAQAERKARDLQELRALIFQAQQDLRNAVWTLVATELGLRREVAGTDGFYRYAHELEVKSLDVGEVAQRLKVLSEQLEVLP